jgi:hypothetical protein
LRIDSLACYVIQSETKRRRQFAAAAPAG